MLGCGCIWDLYWDFLSIAVETQRVFNFVFYIFFWKLRQICLKQNNILYLCCGSYFF